MFEFEKRDDGFRIVRKSDERPVALLDTQVTALDERLKVPKPVVTAILKDKWTLHFTGAKVTPAELKELLAEIDKLP